MGHCSLVNSQLEEWSGTAPQLGIKIIFSNQISKLLKFHISSYGILQVLWTVHVMANFDLLSVSVLREDPIAFLQYSQHHRLCSSFYLQDFLLDINHNNNYVIIPNLKPRYDVCVSVDGKFVRSLSVVNVRDSWILLQSLFQLHVLLGGSQFMPIVRHVQW